MGRTDQKKIYLIYAGAILLCLVIFFYFRWIITHADTTEIPFYKNWELSVNGEDFGRQDTVKFSDGNLRARGDEFVLTNTVPEGVPEMSSVVFSTYLSVVDVEFDGDIVYSYGHDLFDKGLMVGSGYHRVRLPDDAAGKTIRITIKAGDNNAFSRLENIVILDSRKTITYFMTSNFTSFMISVFLVCTGILMPLISIVFFFLKREYERLLVIGLLSLSIGVWTMCYFRLLQIFSSDLAWNSLLEYVSLYLAPIPLMRLVDMINRDNPHMEGWKRSAVYVATGMFGLFFVVSLALHMTNVVHLCELLPYFHGVGLICIAFVVVASYVPLNKLEKSNRLAYAAAAVLFAAALLDVIRFNVQAYFGLGKFAFMDVSVLPLGAFVFIVLLIIGYLIYLYDMYIAQAERIKLQSKAFTDPLTGLYNRAYYEKEIAAICGHLDEYGIVSMDLNGLKYVNDNFGHSKGDLLLVTFAEVLKESFGEVGDVIRMGGDEFLILLRNPSPRETAKCLIDMTVLERKKSEGMPFEMRTAYGEAYSSECKGNDREAVYRLADSRMYDMKKRTKKER